MAARIKAICETRVRYGYRRVQVLLRREGWAVNHKRVHRLYRDEGRWCIETAVGALGTG